MRAAPHTQLVFTGCLAMRKGLWQAALQGADWNTVAHFGVHLEFLVLQQVQRHCRQQGGGLAHARDSGYVDGDPGVNVGEGRRGGRGYVEGDLGFNVGEGHRGKGDAGARAPDMSASPPTSALYGEAGAPAPCRLLQVPRLGVAARRSDSLEAVIW